MNNTTAIKSFEQQEAYKYLEIDEHDGVQHKKMNHKLKNEYYRIIRSILKTKHNSNNKISAITALSVPVVFYSQGIVKLMLAEIRTLERTWTAEKEEEKE